MQINRWPLLAISAAAAVLAATPATAQNAKADAEAKLPAIEGSPGATAEIPDSLRRRKTPPPSEGSARAVERAPELLNAQEVAQAISTAYPIALRERNITGSVYLRFQVNVDGTMNLPSLQTRDATHPEFAEAAAQVARMMRFRPATVSGRPVRAWVTLPVVFELNSTVPGPRIND